MPDWWRTYGKVFQAAIDAGVMSIMPGHFTLPAYQKPKNEYLNGVHPPATLSKALLTDLLKGEMRFQGVIVSDAMLMGGFRGYYDDQLEGEIQSFLAGMDVLLWPSYEFMDEMESRINRGEIPMARLDDAVSRVWEMKRKLKLLNPEPRPGPRHVPGEKAEAQADSRRITEQSLTLVRDRKHALPLDPAKDKKILLLAIVPQSRKGGDGGLSRLQHMKRDLESRFLGGSPAQSPLRDRLLADRSAQALRPHHRNPSGICISRMGRCFSGTTRRSPSGESTPCPRTRSSSSAWVSVLINEYFERVHTCINAYSYDESTQTAVVRALLGEIPFQGSSPVSLERPVFELQ